MRGFRSGGVTAIASTSETSEPGKGSVMGKHLLVMPVLVAVLVVGVAACSPQGETGTASPQVEADTADLVTEEV